MAGAGLHHGHLAQGPHRNKGRDWVLMGTSPREPVPQSRGSAQPDGCQQVFYHLSITWTLLGSRNHVLECTDQSCTSSPSPRSLQGPSGSPTGLSPAQDTNPSPETRDVRSSVDKAFSL